MEKTDEFLASKKTDEKALWLAIQQGNPQAFHLLYMEFSEILYNYGYKMSPDKALIKDCIQDVFKTLWEKRREIIIKSSLRSYIFSIFRRNVIQKIQQQQNSQNQLPEPDFELSIESKIIMGEAQQQLRWGLDQAIETLTPRQKEILFLRYYENVSYQEIAELMSLNQNSMYKLLSAAIQRLKKHFILF